jgi:hypothetical protein
VCPTSPRCDRLSIALRTQSSTSDITMITLFLNPKNSPPPSPSFYTSYCPCHWNKKNNTSRTGLFFYALSRRNSVTTKLLQTNPLNFLHFPANPALLGPLERGLHSPSIKQVRHMMYRGLEGGKSEAKRRKERTSERERSCLLTLRVVLNLYWALQGSNV